MLREAFRPEASSVLYDFTDRIDESHPFVRLDSDGKDRPFDGTGLDSTGATFRLTGSDPVQALRQGEGRDWQWVEGCGRTSAPQSPHSGQYPCYLGAVPSWWAYGSEEGEVTWTTAPVPKSRETAVLFVGATDYAPGRAELRLNGERVLPFDTGRRTDAVWREGKAELRFHFGGDTRDETTPYGLSGVFLLRLPASMVKPGQPLSLAVKMLPGPGWFMLHGYDTVLHMKSGIAAFTPHVKGAFGVTGADHDVDLAD